MEFKLETNPLSRINVDSLVVGVFEEDNPVRQLLKLDKTFPAELLKQIERFADVEGFKGKAGESLTVPASAGMKCGKVVLAGLGKSAEYNPNSTRKMAANLARRQPPNGNAGSLCIFVRAKGDEREHVRAAVEGFVMGGYSFTKYKSSKEDRVRRRPSKITVGGVEMTSREWSAAMQLGRSVADAVVLARDLIAEPAAYMTPTRLAQEAKRVAKEHDLSCTVYSAEQVQKMGMGSFLGVARGAKEPPKFVVIKYVPAKSRKTIALVGKGITFDSGGLSLKTAQGMETMKYDMAGAAAVIATMQAVGQAKPDVTVIGVAALTENMPGGNAMHPGDVLTAMNGKTIEVNNTDAEGRLILADALCYVCGQGPDEIIDIATLTGAVKTALGSVAAGIMGNDQKLVDRVIKAGQLGGEKFWQLPLFDEYKEGLKSDIADLKNAGSRGEAGSSSAGMFLKEFVDGKPWVHLDIAGVGWKDKAKDELNKGGTGFGVRTFCRYILG